MSLLLPIGISDFKELIEKKYRFIDKSLFIQEILRDGAKVILIPRPRRFGKTLNLSMLHYFFNCATTERNAHLFQDIFIQQDADCMAQQGTIPSIFLTLKGIKSFTFAEACQGMAEKMASLYRVYLPLLDREKFGGKEEKDIAAICEGTASPVILKNSLKQLTRLLYEKYQKKVMIFLDEYDAPMHTAYAYGYYEEMVNFMQTFMGEAFKDNLYLEKGVITGILRIAQASIFSDLNNIVTYTLLRRDYSEYFGFTQEEVDVLLTETSLTEHSAEIKDWYNGYQVEELRLYNPWSILNCVQQQGKLQPYWLNTSDNALIKDLLSRAKPAMKAVFETLLQGKSVMQPIEEYIVMPDLSFSEEAIWGLLLSSGYLTSMGSEMSEYGLNCQLRIPNREVGFVYAKMITQWFGASQGLASYTQLLESLTTGNWETFGYILQDYIRSSGSYFDFNIRTPEAVYHAFILGLVVGLREDYIVQSNREAGYGRCDVAIIPKDPSKYRAMILEFKRSEDSDALAQTAQAALDQISEKDYVAICTQHAVKNVTALGIAFAGKAVQIATRDIVL